MHKNGKFRGRYKLGNASKYQNPRMSRGGGFGGGGQMAPLAPLPVENNPCQVSYYTTS